MRLFIGRDFELTELNNQYEKEGFRFIVIYGRRRVGKTALISEFCRDKDTIFYISTERNDKGALDGFSSKVFERYPAPSFLPDGFVSWESAFDYIADHAGNERIVIAIDEYPYLASGNPSISSILQKYIDTRFKQTNIFLILCGSSMSFMRNQVLGYKSPLYGRRSAQFHIEPFDYFDSSQFLPEASAEDKVLAYAVCGGIPQYLNAIVEYGNVTEGICECFLKKTGPLYEEPENLLKQELREPAVYNTLITSIARGASKLNEIATKSGEDSKKCSKYLKALLDLQIIRREQPYGVDSERKSLYSLIDNMYRFWYCFIPQNMTNIEAGMGKQVFTDRIAPFLSDYIGHIFEEICRQYMIRQNKAGNLPFMFDGIGRWWGTNPMFKCEQEIDIIASGNTKALFCECKWRSEKIGVGVLEDLAEKSAMFNFTEKYFMLFSKSGFTTALRGDAKKSDRLYLISLEDLYA